MEIQAFEQGLTLHELPLDAIRYLKLEKEWVAEPFDEAECSEEEARKVGLEQIVCTKCHGTTKIERPYVVKVTGLRVERPFPCQCRLWKKFYPRWHNPANVNADYRAVRMDNLETYSENLNAFREEKAFTDLLADVRKYRFNCYLLCGPSGTGKTTLMTAIYHRALMEWAELSYQYNVPTPAVWKVHGGTLALQFRDWEMRGDRPDDVSAAVKPPDVSLEQVVAAVRVGHVPSPLHS
jgi:hypothetical protein